MTLATGSCQPRQAGLEYVRQRPDLSVLVIGAGINGAGTFRDLALQGVDVLLVDKGDFCSGASAASSRMIHGGLRYLEYGEFRLVREALRERNLLLQNAPHYVHPLPTTIPIRYWFSGSISCIKRFFGLGGDRPADRGAVLIKLGLMFYDLVTGKSRQMPRHRFTSRKKSLQRRPSLPTDILCTATYYDAWVSQPERLCFEVIADGEASCDRAKALNYIAVQGASGANVTLRDDVSGAILKVRPRVVINATGAWIDFTNRTLSHATTLIGGTKGAHLVVDSAPLLKAFDGEMIYFENADGRTAVALPWLGKALIGTTDIRIDDPELARCEEGEVEYILEAIARVFPAIKIERRQILSHFSGVRPLPRSNATTTGQISRNHHCVETEPRNGINFPVLSLVGGKWTTFRAFSEQVTDNVLARLKIKRRAATTHLAIGGGKDYPRNPEDRAQWLLSAARIATTNNNRIETLLERYGTTAEAVARFISSAPDSHLQNHQDYTRREIEYLVQHENVVRLDDLVLRRTPLALLGELTEPLLDELAAIAAPLLGWDSDQTRTELDRTRVILRERFGIILPNGKNSRTTHVTN
ncbi:MAG: glycerol-3-phosphate dehydrogenase/oxidase [Candidatus Hydrogenedentes bacterium]|nr:glycerol-3-phosphate dehydrogenase/oxidase [Candidatus Hydrogenedentota bacterium]